MLSIDVRDYLTDSVYTDRNHIANKEELDEVIGMNCHNINNVLIHIRLSVYCDNPQSIPETTSFPYNFPKPKTVFSIDGTSIIGIFDYLKIYNYFCKMFVERSNNTNYIRNTNDDIIYEFNIYDSLHTKSQSRIMGFNINQIIIVNRLQYTYQYFGTVVYRDFEKIVPQYINALEKRKKILNEKCAYVKMLCDNLENINFDAVKTLLVTNNTSFR